MANYLHGAATRLKIDVSPLSRETKCNVTLTMKPNKTASFSDLDWDTLRNGLTSWKASASGLMSYGNFATMLTMLMTHEVVPFEFTVGNTTFKGIAIITSVKIHGRVRGIATWDLSLLGSGTLHSV